MWLIAWLGLPPAPAGAQLLPDAGAQRERMITELRQANERLAEAVQLLRDIREQGKKNATARPTRTSSAAP